MLYLLNGSFNLDKRSLTTGEELKIHDSKSHLTTSRHPTNLTTGTSRRKVTVQVILKSCNF